MVNAAAAGVSVEFETSDAATVDGEAQLVCIFEALHDMSQPVAVLSRVRTKLASDGALLVVDERVGDTFAAPADHVERMMYGWSVLHCLPVSHAESPSAALGTVLRRPMVEQLATEAGFRSVETLEIDNDLFRFYVLRPG